MSYFSEIFSSSNQSVDSVQLDLASSVLSATGLSRSILATLIRQDGLFGHESDLSPVEQAIVQSRLGPISGLRAKPVLAPTDARLVALESFTDTLVRAGGRTESADEEQLVAAGYSEAAVSEVVRVVRMARDVFGLAPARNAPAYARAA